MSEPAHPGRQNEDWFVERDGVAVLLDGAGGLVPLESGCIHGVPWFVRTLAEHLADEAADRGRSLTESLANAIQLTAQAHQSTCDLANPDSPTSTVVVARLSGELIDYLVLADSTLLYGPVGQVVTVTDNRIRLLTHGALVTRSDRAAHMRRLAEHRNQDGGFWVAGPQPAAAAHGYTGTIPIDATEHVTLLSDGAARLVDVFHLATWDQVIPKLLSNGPAWLIREVREAENADPDGHRWPRSKVHDDATAAVLLLHC